MTLRRRGPYRARAALTAVGVGILSAAACASNSGEADRELMLGRLATFGSQAEAEAACAPDAVVWADRYAGYYYLPGEAPFGTTEAGAFACRRGAAAANYWDTDPRSSMSGQPGRVIPYRPLYVGS